jgi:glutamyl-Q tRNA(Asp) synthetase
MAFLGQQPPAELARATLKHFWAWALQNWSLARVPRTAAAPAPAQG